MSENTEKKVITITRALTMLKSLKKQIGEMSEEMTSLSRASNRSLMFIGVAVGKGDKRQIYASKSPGTPVADLEKQITGNMQSFEQLHSNYVTLKQRIVESNAKTMVNVNGTDMPIASAIVMKSLLPLKKQMLETLMVEQALSTRLFDSARVAKDAAIDKVPNTIQDKDDLSETMIAALEELRNKEIATKEELMEPSYVDPINLAEKIKSLKKEIEFMETELDSVITVSNSITVIQAI